MHHFFEAITNTKGDSLVGFYGRVIDTATAAVVPIYADNGGTAIETISGVAHMAVTDADGNLSFYVEPGTYHLDIYNTNATTFVKRVSNIAMAGDITEAAQEALEAAQAAQAAAEAAQEDAWDAAAAAASNAEQTALDVVTVTNAMAAIPTRVSKGLATSRSSTATLAVDPELSFELAASRAVAVRGVLYYSTGSSGGFKWSLTGPTTSDVHIVHSAVAPGGTALSAVAVDNALSTSVSVTGGTGIGAVSFEGYILNSSGAGTVAVNFAQAASDATATILKRGSFIEHSAVPVQTTYTFTGPGESIARIGEFPGPTSGGGHNYYQPLVGPSNQVGSYLETMVTGSKFEMYMFGPGTYSISVDGAAPVSYSPSAGWNWVTVFSELPDAPHRVQMYAQYVEGDTAWRITGVAPSFSRPSDIPDYHTLATSSTIAQEGMTRVDNNLGLTNAQRIWDHGSGFGLRFTATTTRVVLWLYDGLSPNRMVLLQDGVEIADVSPAGALGAYSLITFASGLDGASHDYEVQIISKSPKLSYVSAVLCDGLSVSANPARGLDVHYGDSIVALSDVAVPTNFDTRQHDAYIIAHATTHSAVRLGYGGQRVSTFLKNSAASALSPLPQTPVRIFNSGGTNDMSAGINVATFQADYRAMLVAQRGAVSGARIYARGILPRVGYTSQRLTYNAAIAAAVTSIADANIVYINTDGWIDPTAGVDTYDGLHPNPSGYAKIAAAQLLVL